jgi:hypothetical protein
MMLTLLVFTLFFVFYGALALSLLPSILQTIRTVLLHRQ